jgi:tetratricopeptide (TPR) repeat protein
MNSLSSKIEAGTQHKNTGNELFKSGQAQQALGSYHSALLYLKGKLSDSTPGLDSSKFESLAGRDIEPIEQATKDEINKQLIAVHSNMAACYLKLEKLDKTLSSCDQVLALDAKHAKATFRKGQALKALRNFDKAEKILKEAVVLAPNDSGIRAELQAVRDEIKALELKSREELKRNLKI